MVHTGVLNVAERMTTWAEKVEAGAASGERAPMQEIEIWSHAIHLAVT